MKKSNLIAVAVAALVALTLVACGGSSGGGSDASMSDGLDIEQVSENVVKVTIGNTSDACEFDVTVAEGDAYVVAGNLEAGEVEITTTVAEGDMSDYLYQGYGVSETEIAPGSCHVVVSPNEATGTVYVLSYPAGQIDFMNTDSDVIYDQIAEFAGV